MLLQRIHGETGYNIQEQYRKLVAQNGSVNEITNINLGIVEREQPNLSIKSDIDNAQIKINGYEHTYKYAKRLNNETEYGDGFNVKVKLGQKYNTSYVRGTYESDLNYNPEDKEKELKVYITYKILVQNSSTNLPMTVNELVNYYDSSYLQGATSNTLIESWAKYADTTKNISWNTTSKYGKTYNQNGFVGIYTTDLKDFKIMPQTQVELYLKFEFSRQAVLDLMNQKDKLDNVVEINAYSSYEKDGNTIYAGVDVDSAPGNCTPGNTNTYEDDTDAAPSLKFELINAREITGKVFEDTTTGELQVGQIREGSGAYEDGEPGIAGVEVTLNSVNGEIPPIKTTTNENGDYTISGFIPGEYTITYTWGDKKYTVQNYKGTKYDINRDTSNKQWYKENVETRLSDAMDDYELRKQIDNQVSEIDNSKITQINTAYESENSDIITKMNSLTPVMEIPIEYDSTQTDNYDEFELDDNGNVKYNEQGQAIRKDKFIYRIKNVDFGIVERARQNIELQKEVSKIKIVLANGQILLEGNPKDKLEGVMYLAPAQNDNGQVYIQIDSSILHGSTLQIEYDFKITNMSEVEYLSDSYYKYGIFTDSDLKATLKPLMIIDYLDNSYTFDKENNPKWTLQDNKDSLASDDGILSKDLGEIVKSYNQIITTDELENTLLVPGETKSVQLNVSKLLTNSDDLTFDNDAEIIKVLKTGGSTLENTPGNYIPGNPIESDESRSETITVTTPTGENQGYGAIIAIVIVAGIVLAGGIVIIKRKAL